MVHHLGHAKECRLYVKGKGPLAARMRDLPMGTIHAGKRRRRTLSIAKPGASARRPTGAEAGASRSASRAVMTMTVPLRQFSLLALIRAVMLGLS